MLVGRAGRHASLYSLCQFLRTRNITPAKTLRHTQDDHANLTTASRGIIGCNQMGRRCGAEFRRNGPRV